MKKNIQKISLLLLWISLFFVYRIILFRNGIVEHVINGRHEKDLYDILFVLFTLLVAIVYIFVSKKKQKK